MENHDLDKINQKIESEIKRINIKFYTYNEAQNKINRNLSYQINKLEKELKELKEKRGVQK